MVGATLGRLAFLLAFTFGMAADAFHARKEALVEEVSAIRMAYQLSDRAPQAHREEIRTVLREYVDQRLRRAVGQPAEPGKSANRQIGKGTARPTLKHRRRGRSVNAGRGECLSELRRQDHRASRRTRHGARTQPGTRHLLGLAVCRRSAGVGRHGLSRRHCRRLPEPRIACRGGCFVRRHAGDCGPGSARARHDQRQPGADARSALDPEPEAKTRHAAMPAPARGGIRPAPRPRRVPDPGASGCQRAATGDGLSTQPVKRLPCSAICFSSGAMPKPSPMRGACFSSAATTLAAPTVSA